MASSNHGHQVVPPADSATGAASGVGVAVSLVDGVAVAVAVWVTVAVRVSVVVAVWVSVFVTVSAGLVGTVAAGVVGTVAVGSVSVGAVSVGAVSDGRATLGTLTLGRDVGREMEPLPEHAASKASRARVVTSVAARLMRDCPRMAPVHGVTHRG